MSMTNIDSQTPSLQMISVRATTPAERRERRARHATVQLKYDAPVRPNRDWFYDLSDTDVGQRMTVEPDGRVHGCLAQRGRTMLADDGREWTIPEFSPSRYEIAHQGAVVCSNGEVVAVALVGEKHEYNYDRRVASAHYGDPGRARMMVRLHDVVGGVLAVGTLVPGLSEDEIARVRRSSWSGDWRWLPAPMTKVGSTMTIGTEDGYDLVGLCLVNTPGLPITVHRPRAAAAAPVHATRVASAPGDELAAYSARIAAAEGRFQSATLHCEQQRTQGREAWEAALAITANMSTDVHLADGSRIHYGNAVGFDTDGEAIDINTVSLPFLHELSAMSAQLDQFEQEELAAYLAALDEPVPRPVLA